MISVKRFSQYECGSREKMILARKVFYSIVPITILDIQQHLERSLCDKTLRLI